MIIAAIVFLIGVTVGGYVIANWGEKLGITQYLTR